jgi:hypothetical protein
MIVMLSALRDQPVSQAVITPALAVRLDPHAACAGLSARPSIGATRRPCRLITAFHLWTTLLPVWMI